MNQLESIATSLETIRTNRPLIHNITNYVVMNSTANALLALGASPVMAHAIEEVEEMVSIAGALVINIGTLDRPWVQAMEKAMAKANTGQVPIVLDPVGVGATSYRTRTALSLALQFNPTIIRGNASEILAMTNAQARTKGVDSDLNPEEARTAGQRLAREFNAVVVISGATDLIIGKDEIFEIRNGHPMMGRVTGIGCTCSALCGAFAAVTDSPLTAAVQAMAVMGVAGKQAALQAKGPGTLQLHFYDTLYHLDAATIQQEVKLKKKKIST